MQNTNIEFKKEKIFQLISGYPAENIKDGTAVDKTGDIIVFDAQGLWSGAPLEPIVHRVIGKYNISDTWYFLTKGDANPSADPQPVPESRIIGVVVGRIPYIGWVKII